MDDVALLDTCQLANALLLPRYQAGSCPSRAKEETNHHSLGMTQPKGWHDSINEAALGEIKPCWTLLT
jgi:hypothetical protein